MAWARQQSKESIQKTEPQDAIVTAEQGIVSQLIQRLHVPHPFLCKKAAHPDPVSHFLGCIAQYVLQHKQLHSGLLDSCILGL